MLKRIFVLAIVGLICLNAFADVKLPNIISDDMVLQQQSVAKIWGWAEHGEQVEVNPLWLDGSVKTVADDNGEWKAEIKTPKAGGPFEIAIKGNNEILLKNIMIGEVWLCSGQSNMQMSFKPSPWTKGVLNYEEEIANADYPKMRLFTVPNVSSGEPKDNCGGEWKVCNPETVADFSAVGYFFGREIHEKLGVAVGLINSSWGGSPAEAWTRIDYLEDDSDFKPILDRYAKAEETYPEKLNKYEEETLPEWQKAKAKAEAEGKDVPKKPKKPVGPKVHHRPSGLYNSMIHPLLNLSIKGVIWYQGESNSWRAYQYRKLFPTMIENWREDFGNSDMPFLFVQIAPFHYKTEYIGSELMEAQLLTLKNVENTGMVVTNDLAPNLWDIHPRNKQDVGKRLSLWALAKAYGKDFIAYSGPIYRGVKFEDGKAIVSFDHVYDALTAKGGKLEQFEIAGEDKEFVKADAVIKGKKVVVSSDKVAEPVAVRYCWGNTKVGNLYNSGSLPARPFRTDDWKGVTYNSK